MKLSNDDDNRRREIFTELENLRHHLRNINAMIQDARLRGKTGVVDLLITRRNSYLRRETELENVLETYYNIFYRRYL
ncbi:hypothetical protein R3W88_011684 [Solanum pinnatisectum]|uniref:Uncharacterized protein n=1 Tax=Solanum pinnatisectum TaxID=50273 RepID=A0AAV9L6W1_9SOLN|nr:hypothetical protein R3W88_011684 [Solanum pinnatisectum]